MQVDSARPRYGVKQTDRLPGWTVGAGSVNLLAMGTAARIHPTALVDPRARLAPSVVVGAYAVIDGAVTIGEESVVHEHTVMRGTTIVGRNCRIGPAAYVGMDPQHLRFVPDEANPTWLVIGNNVTIRESARLHRSTAPGQDHATRIGDGCFLMGAVHVGHDCVLEPHVTLADAVLLGGHCRIGQGSFLGGGCTIHQFVQIGRLVIVAGNEALARDVPPFAAVLFGRLKGYNAIGCRRAGIARIGLTSIRGVFQRLRQHRQTSNAVNAIRSEVPDLPEVREILGFIASSRRGILPSHHLRPGASRFTAGEGEGSTEEARVDRGQFAD